MASLPIYDPFHDDVIWAGFPPERALAWTRVLARRRPSWPGAGPMWMLTQALKEGRPAGISGWADRAREAEAIGLGPDRYLALHESLDRVPRDEHASHPDNDLDRTWRLHPLRDFDTALWSPLAALLDDGMEQDEVTRLLLTLRDAELLRAEL